MSVNVGDRKESSIEFDNTYFKIHDDVVFLIKHNFGAKDDNLTNNLNYITMVGKKTLDIVLDIGTNIRIANSIFPQDKSELAERRLQQNIAIGLCYDLLTKYQLIMRTLKINQNRYTHEIKNLIHEINCLKRWRKSYKKNFKYLYN